MGSMAKEDAERFARMVLDCEKYSGWGMQWGCAPSICLRDRKLIIIREKIIGWYPWQVKEEILHEIAHIPTIEDKGHGTIFYEEYVRLLKKYMASREQEKIYWDRKLKSKKEYLVGFHWDRY